MIKLNARHHSSSSPSSSSSFPANDPAVAALQHPSQSDPGFSLTQDSDGEDSLEHDEKMRLFMRTKAETVIASHIGDSLSAFDVQSILSGLAPSLHPGSLTNVTWTLDMYESGAVLPTISSKKTSTSSVDASQRAGSGGYSLMSTDSSTTSASDEAAQKEEEEDQRDLNHDGIVSVDELLASFFHADHVKHVFNQVEAQTSTSLNKNTKKEIIKQTAPILHKTIEKVASHRGWGIQDARFAVLHHQEEDGESGGGENGGKAFEDYNTFVKTMRSALITPRDAAKSEVKEQEAVAVRTDPTTKA